MKKLLALALLLCLASAACAESAFPRARTYPDNEYVMPPFSYLRNDSPARGRVVRFEYDVTDHVNGTGAPSRKYALVYLPEGYDPEDAQTRYNVLYLMHGGGDSPEWFLGGEGRTSAITHMLDSMIHAGEIPPLIVCAVSYYTDYSSDATRNCLSFRHELTEDLMPAFEAAFRTYAEDVTDEAFAASRGHRAFGGFSMGAVTTWSVFGYCLDRFAYFLPISGDCWELGMTAGSSRADATAAFLARRVAESGYGPGDFIIYSGCGSFDMAEPNLTPQIEAMSRLTDTFVRCENFADGNLYECVFQGGGHDARTVGHVLYNGLLRMFD